MNVNVNNLKKLLGKATLNNSIETVQLSFDDVGKVSSKMISGNRDAVVLLNIDNDVITGMKKPVEMNFRETNKDFIPFLNLINEEEAKMQIKDEKLIISNGKQKSNIHFCAPQVVSVFEGEMDANMETFYSSVISEDFVDSFIRIKKVGSRFGFVYFIVDNKTLYIETTDKSNKFSNGLRIELQTKVKSEDISLCFDYKNFSNLMSIVNGDFEKFRISLYFVESHNAGLLKMEKMEDKSEVYYLMSIIEEG